MKIRQPIVSVFVIASLLMASMQPAFAAQSKLYSLLAPKAVAPAVNEDCPKGMTEAKFNILLGQYPKVYNDKSASLEQWDLEDQVTNAVFCAVGTPDYLAYLKLLNDVAASPLNQDAYYNLAKRLQAHWQTQYALAISKIQQQRMQSVSDKSMMISILLTALSLFSKNAAQVPTLFSMIRGFFPILLPAAAVGSTELINKYGLLEGRYPVSPAHVMTFPLPSDSTNYNWYDIEKNVGAAVASVCGAQLATKLVGAVTEAVTFGKFTFNPWTIAASVAIGYAVQDGTKYTLDLIKYHNLKKDYLQERDNLARAVSNKDYMGMRTSAENFQKAAIYLSSFTDQQSLNVWVDYDSDVKSATGNVTWKKWLATDLQFYTGKTSEYLSPDDARKKSNVEAAGKTRDEKLEVIQAAEDPVSLQDVQLEIAMNIMGTSPDNTSLLEGEQKTQGQIIAAGFQQYKSSQAPLVMSEEEMYKTYLSKLDQDRNAMLVQELMEGKVYRNPSHVLLQAASYIRSLNQPILNSIGDDLLNIIFSGELFK